MATNIEKNPVSNLQELSQKYFLPFPAYVELNSEGPPQARTFFYQCELEGFKSTGHGLTKKEAKREAAKNMLSVLQESNLLQPHKMATTSTINRHHMAQPKNPTSALLEFCVKERIAPPKFLTTQDKSPIKFICECQVEDKVTFGRGCSKKTAKTATSALMCATLGIPYDINKVETKEQVDTGLSCAGLKEEEEEVANNDDDILALEALVLVDVEVESTTDNKGEVSAEADKLDDELLKLDPSVMEVNNVPLGRKNMAANFTGSN